MLRFLTGSADGSALQSFGEGLRASPGARGFSTRQPSHRKHAYSTQRTLSRPRCHRHVRAQSTCRTPVLTSRVNGGGGSVATRYARTTSLRGSGDFALWSGGRLFKFERVGKRNTVHRSGIKSPYPEHTRRCFSTASQLRSTSPGDRGVPLSHAHLHVRLGAVVRLCVHGARAAPACSGLTPPLCVPPGAARVWHWRW